MNVFKLLVNLYATKSEDNSVHAEGSSLGIQIVLKVGFSLQHQPAAAKINFPRQKRKEGED